MIIDFAAFERDFLAACLDGLNLLIERYNADPYYAISIYVDGFDGDFGLYANTARYFERTLAEYQRNYPDSYRKPIEIQELKYNCGDWAYQLGMPEDFDLAVSSKLSAWSKHVYDLSYNQRVLELEHYPLFDEAACRVATSRDLLEALQPLNKTSDFLITVSGHDEPELASIYRPQWFAEKGSLEGFDPYAYSSHR